MVGIKLMQRERSITGALSVKAAKENEKTAISIGKDLITTKEANSIVIMKTIALANRKIISGTRRKSNHAKGMKVLKKKEEKLVNS